ncbi:MAG: hypothetical protein GX881_05405 [Firmicutes bacterium]|nr:hypothetical protein [Bacillota bacterium]
MSPTIRKRCIICGREFEVETLGNSPLVEDLFPGPPQKSSSVCPLCEAKIKKEAKDTQDEPKPM